MDSHSEVWPKWSYWHITANPNADFQSHLHFPLSTELDVHNSAAHFEHPISLPMIW